MKSRGLGPHSRRHRLGYIDGRTFEGRLYNQYRDQLLAHAGPNPPMTVRALIDRACWVHLKCALMDQEIARGSLSDFDAKMYLAWANTERRILGQLGLHAAPAPRRPIAEIFAERAAERERAANGAAA